MLIIMTYFPDRIQKSKQPNLKESKHNFYSRIYSALLPELKVGAFLDSEADRLATQ